MAVVSDIEIRLRADIARLQQDLNQARRSVSTTMTDIAGYAKKAAAALAAIGGVSAFAGFIKGAIDATDALNDLSVRTKISIEDLSGLAYAAKISDSTLEGIAGSVSKLATNIGKDADKFRRLGVTAQDPIEAFKQLSDIFKAIQDPQTRAAFGAEALGKTWQESAVLLNEGSAGIDALIKKGQELAGVTAETAEQAGMFNDKLDDLGFIVQGAGQRLAAELLPMLSLLVDDLTSAAKGANEANTSFSPLTETLRALVIFAGNVAFTFKAVGTEIGVWAAQIVQYHTALFQLTTFDPKGALSTLRGAFGKGGIGDQATEDAEKARKAFDEWEQGWLTVGTAAAKVREEAAVPFPDPFGIDGQFEQEAAARAVAFIKDSENQAKAKKAADEAAATAKKQAEAYRSLTTAINVKLVETYREANGLAALTEGQKIAMDIEQKILEGKLSLNAAQRAGVKVALDEIDANAAAVESQKTYKKMLEDIARDEKKLADERADAIRKAEEEADANEKLVETFGQTKAAIAQVELARLEEQLAQRSSVGMTLDEIETLEALIAAKKRSAAAIAKVEDLEQQRDLWKSIEDTAHKTFVSIADGGKNAAQRLKDTFKNIFFDWLYQQTLKKWIINLQGDTSISGALSSLGGGGAAGSASSIFGSASNLLTIGKTIYSGFTGGFTTMLGSAITTLGETFGSAAVSSFGSGLYGGAGSALSGAAGAGASAASAIPIVGWIIAGMNAANSLYKQGWDFNNGSVNALGKVLGSGINLVDKLARGLGLSNTAANIISGLAPVSKLFGRKNPEITAQGITGTFSASGFSGQAFADILEKGGIFRSDKRYTKTADLTAEQDASFDATIKSMIASVKDFGQAMGLQTTAIDGYSKQIKLELTNDEAKNKEAITALFAGIGDELATALLPSIAKFSAEGETAAATLQRLATDFLSVTELLRVIGVDATKAFGTVAETSIEARERLIALAGGLEAFAQQTDFFVQNFLSGAERIAPVQKYVTEQLAALGYAGVSTSDQFKDAVLELASSGKLATEAGATTYAGLLALAPAFKELTDYLTEAKAAAEELAAAQVDSLRTAAGEAFALLQRSVDSDKEKLKASFDDLMARLGDSITAQQAKVTKLQGLSSALSGARVGTVADQQFGASRSLAQGQLAAALALARSTGYLPGADTLKDALALVSRDAADQFDSFVDYQRDQLRTQNTIEELSGLTGTQLTTAERTLAVLQAQQASAQAAYNAEVARLDGLLASGQTQIDAINGVNLSVTSATAAFAALQTTLLAALGNTTIAAGPSAGSAQIEALYQSIFGRHSDMGGLAYWTEQLRSGMSLDAIRDAFLSSTEYQYLRPQQSGTMSGNSAVVAQLQTLNDRMANVETHTSASATSGARLATDFANVSGGGNALLVENA